MKSPFGNLVSINRSIGLLCMVQGVVWMVRGEPIATAVFWVAAGTFNIVAAILDRP